MGFSKENSLFHNVFRTESSFSEALCKRGCSLIAEGFESDRTFLVKVAEVVLKLAVGGALIAIGAVTSPVGAFVHFGLIFRTATRTEDSGYHHGPGGRRVRYRGNSQFN